MCGKDTDCFRLEFRRRYAILIVIDVFFLWTTPLGCKVMLTERILLWKRDHRGIEPVKRLLRNWITYKIVMAGRSLKDMEKSITGLTDVGYGS
jgi:hypothetical protein